MGAIQNLRKMGIMVTWWGGPVENYLWIFFKSNVGLRRKLISYFTLYLTSSLHSLYSLCTGSTWEEPVLKEVGGRGANGIAAPWIQIVEATHSNTILWRLKICQGQHWIWTKVSQAITTGCQLHPAIIAVFRKSRPRPIEASRTPCSILCAVGAVARTNALSPPEKEAEGGCCI